MNKKGEIFTEEVLFIILNVIYFGMLLVFVVSSSSGARIYDEVYAKQIALMIDEAEQGMFIKMNIDDLVEVTKKNEVDLENVFLIKDNKVSVRTSSLRAFSYPYFSSYDVEYNVGVEEGDYFLALNIGGENE